MAKLLRSATFSFYRVYLDKNMIRNRLLTKAPSCFQERFKVCSKRTYAHQTAFKELTSEKPPGPWGYFLLIVPVATFCLGTWQVKRRKWKLDLIKSLEDKITQAPVELPEDLTVLDTMEYRQVKVRGTFDHSKEQYIGPRSLLQKKESRQGGGLISSGQTGFHVVTPFKLADQDLVILVNRGWVPKQKLNPQTRKEGQVQEEVEITGVVRLPENRAPFVPKNDPNSKFWHWRDVTTLAQKLGTSPVFLDADEKSSFIGGPKGGQTIVSLRNEHFSYIITWFSLSAATSFLWYRKFIRKQPLML